MKVAIITMHAARNYGAVLQTYALQKFLQDKGAQVEIIDYRRKNQELVGYLFNVNTKFKNSKFMSVLFILKSFIPKLCTSCLFSKFLKRKINLSSKVGETDNIRDKINADVYCTGSDQVWNPLANSGFDPMFFLRGTFPKVSYAASIGLHNLELQYHVQMREYLESYKAISIREQSSLAILKNLGIKGECVLDPSLLLTNNDWDKFATLCNRVPKKYLLVYYFGNTASIMKIADKIAKDKGFKIVRISVGFENYKEDDVVLRYLTPEEFVGVFSKASFVLTNSFHGTAFSINYSVNFLTYPTTEHNARFDSILDLFNLQSRNIRLLHDPVYASHESIDWNRVNQILEEKRILSYQFIENNILK